MPDTRFHPLSIAAPLPAALANPFAYAPDAWALEAVRALQRHLPDGTCHEAYEGKMFGVLVAKRTNPATQQAETGYLAAFSGQLSDDYLRQSRFPMTAQEADAFFVPLPFNYLAPGSHFVRKMAEIEQASASLEQARAHLLSHEQTSPLRKQLDEARRSLEAKQAAMKAAKRLRDERRAQAPLTAQEAQTFIRESQFLKAEVRRAKAACARLEAALREAETAARQPLEAAEAARRQQSDALQTWLFSHFTLPRRRGGEASLIEIFRRAVSEGVRPASGSHPTSGAGECCEPKLLAYAFRHGYEPLSMAMFWWGAAGRGEMRLHGRFYPACEAKCRPVLTWMLGPEAVRLPQAEDARLDILYEDEALLVVDKPAGLLSVPGRSARPSVQSILQRERPEAAVLMVHRLDMATSGLLVVAKTPQAHRHLQCQFAARTVEKTYLARLSAPRPIDAPQDGEIALRLLPDLADRPRQKVDPEHGRRALTHFRFVGATDVLLEPHTGRTHQLRVHCASPQGLGCPILGDVLYGGSPAPRLCLHAARLCLTHPLSGARLCFESPRGFDTPRRGT